MKIITKNKIYVQLNDINFMMKILPFISLKCPKKLLEECFKKVYFVDEVNKYNFIEFDDEEIIDFFKKISFIVDYDKYKKMNYKEITECIENIGDELHNISDIYNGYSEIQKMVNYKKITALCKMKYHKLNSIRDIYKFKNNEIIFDLPIKEKKKLFKK